MTQEIFPEIQAATQALEKQMALTETEIDQMKETIAGKPEHYPISLFQPEKGPLNSSRSTFSRYLAQLSTG